MYKDKDRQKEASRLASKRYRDKRKGMTEGMTNKRNTVIPKPINVIPIDKAQYSSTGGVCRWCGCEVAPIASSCRTCSNARHG